MSVPRTALGCLLALALLIKTRAEDGTASLTQAQEHFQQGYSYQTGEDKEKDLKKALAYYRRALKLAPNLFPALYNTALIYHYQKDYKRAQSFFIKAARAARQEEEKAVEYEALARNGLGNCYQMQGNFREAEKQFSAAIHMHPQLVEAHFNLINLRIKEERWEEAQKALEVAKELAPSDRYEIFRGRLRSKEEQQGNPAVGGVLGIILFLMALVFYSLYLRRKRQT